MNRTTRRVSMGLAIFSLALPLLLSSCGDAGSHAKNKAPVILLALFENDSFDPGIDVRLMGHEYINLTLKVLPLDPQFEDPDTQYMDVILHDYTVSFTRTDSGVDVPAAITEFLSMSVPCCDAEVDIRIPWLRAEQKIQIPLLYLDESQSYGYEPSTGLVEISCTMHIHFHGKTVSGRSVTADFMMPVYFHGGGLPRTPQISPTPTPTPVNSPTPTPTPVG